MKRVDSSARRALAVWVFGAVVLAGAPARAAQVSGTVNYTGSLGPVSPQRPIVVALLDMQGGAVAVAPLEVNPAAFALDVAPGTYLLGVLVDVIPDGAPNVGEPIEFYDERFDVASADLLVVPEGGVSGLTVELDDSGRIAGVAGTITYTGGAGPVSPERPMVVALFADPELTQQVAQVEVGSNPGRFDLVTFNTGTYYLRAFLDIDGMNGLGGGEPFVIHADRGAPPGDPVAASVDANALALEFDDAHVVATATPAPPTPTPIPATATPSQTATITPTATAALPTASATATAATPVPGCPGDCNGDGTVLVNELITGVNIALGSLPLPACAAIDADGNGTVAVNELIRAVGSALSGC